MSGSLEGVEIDPQKFASAVDRIVTDRALQKRLRSDPERTLDELGIRITDADRARLVADDFATISAGGAGGGIGPVAETYVKVGVEVVVGVVVGVASDVMVQEIQQEVTRANLGRIQIAARAGGARGRFAIPDPTDLRRRLEVAVQFAEVDEGYRTLLREDPVKAFARFQIEPVDLQFVSGLDIADDDGCADTTCWVSMCPETCYVTVCSPSGFDGDPAVVDPAELVGRPIDNVLRQRGLHRVKTERG